ncbi:hypothetical protein LMG27952_03118 [Paraburkholderia hiiakae]|uniref:Uncharacterized protein n=1 Tax=Paraburkholderia hiiakae TaxID=1081782 RepID=A0ABM8NP75_9BURK|nr:hypothetical protein LMG27952_03118 [Paraburkholderia hiiakae]
MVPLCRRFGGKFRPDFMPVGRTKVAARNSAAGFALDRNAKLFTSDALSVDDVPKEGMRRTAPNGEPLAI